MKNAIRTIVNIAGIIAGIVSIASIITSYTLVAEASAIISTISFALSAIISAFKFSDKNKTLNVLKFVAIIGYISMIVGFLAMILLSIIEIKADVQFDYSTCALFGKLFAFGIIAILVAQVTIAIKFGIEGTNYAFQGWDRNRFN